MKHADAEILVKAAEFISQEKNKKQYGYDGACDVLDHDDYPFRRGDLRLEFRAIFVEPDDYFIMTDILSEHEAQEVRVLALCFMAAMAETP